MKIDMVPDDRINLLFLLQTFRTGGSERIVKTLCDHLDPKKFKCFVMALNGGEMQDEFLAANIPAYCVFKQGNDYLKIMHKISRFIKENKIHVINAHHFSPFFHGFYGAKKNGCRIIYTAHSRVEVDKLGTFWSLIGRIMLHFSYGAIGISQPVSDSIEKVFRLGKDKTFTIENAIDHRRFEIDVDVEKKKESLGIKNNERIICSVGSLRHQKNYKNLIKAFNLLREKANKVKLLIVGEGKRRNELEEIIKQFGLRIHVFLLGARLDVPEILKVTDIFCLASFYEGLPVALLEAMSAGIPVVGTNVDGINDVIMDGKTGLLVESDNPEDLSEALLKLLENSAYAKELSQNGYIYVIDKHSMKKWILAHEVLFMSKTKRL